jgi:hypothetical protein
MRDLSILAKLLPWVINPCSDAVEKRVIVLHNLRDK